MTGLIQRLLQSVAERASRRTIERLAEAGFADEIAYRTASEAALLDLRDGETLCERFANISDGYWFWLLTEGRRRNPAMARFVPGMPSESVQLRYTGDAGDATLREGYQAYKLFRDTFERHAGPLKRDTCVLDFGCGWGRIIRFFLKDVTAPVGADPVDEVLAEARATIRGCRFEVIPFTPPSQLPAESFDLIYSFSVFSHLSEERARLVIDELSRVLAPGGLAMITTRTRDFIDYCAKLRADAKLAADKPGHTSSAVAFPDPVIAKRRYDAGEYCFHSFAAGGDWVHWGEAAIPQAYVQREWKQLEFVEFIDDPTRLAQAVIVLRKAAK